MTTRTVVLMAMEPELAALRARMSDVTESREHGLLRTRGELAGQPVTAVLCGIGKVAAATAATAVALEERPRVLISAGVAGGVRRDVATGSLLVVSGAVEHDYDLRPFVPDRAHGFAGPRLWRAAEAEVTALHQAARATCQALSEPVAVLEAWTATGDHVVTDREKHTAIRALGASVACVDMETAAVAYVAESLNVPWAGLRVISDGADEHLEVDPVLTRALDAGALLADVLEHYVAR
ncbi:MAG: adenosylhomocysteine nucleosidase [Actinomycetota bacterium]|jgi:adenosylhomocysteine nucleosidase|nr:adenosylhomocysteine nucleosidase [Actinomycetota bacterium]